MGLDIVNVELFSLILFLGAIFAGMLGALTGLGGGVVVIPLLTLGFGVDMRYAIGAALVTSIATSSGAAAAYIKERITNVRIGMVLKLFFLNKSLWAVFVLTKGVFLQKAYYTA